MGNRTQDQSIFNFGAGPACLPKDVLNQIREDIPIWHDGMSVLEIGHRTSSFLELTQTIEQDFRTLLSIPDEFAVLFMQGGARSQFAGVPLNLLNNAKTADYIVTGIWSQLAFEEAKKYCQPNCVASSESEHFTYIPKENTWRFHPDAAYVHYTDNETIHGVEFHHVPPSNGKWLISDMTSNLLTKPLDFSRYGLIYASAQKNLGVAGLTVVIVRKALLGKAHPLTPSTLDYGLYAESQSMYNTPPVFCWYVLGLVLKWAIKQGGLDKLTSLCQQKAKLIYDLIDRSDFYTNAVMKECRSRVNIPFQLPTPELETLFVSQASENGLKQLKGHRAVGGCRVSFYNAMPLIGVEALLDFMREFERTH